MQKPKPKKLAGAAKRKPRKGKVWSDDLRRPDMISTQLGHLVRLIRKAP